MDPYLEPHWLDVHASLAIGSRDSLNEQLPDDLVAHVEERVAIESQGGEAHLFGPDVRVFEPAADMPASVEEPSGVVQAPYRLLAQVEPKTERFVRVMEAGTERLVTVIAFLDYLEIYDEEHSQDEDRFIAIGPVAGRIVLVVYTEGPEDTIRVISARPATQHEAQLYRKHGG